MMFLIKSKQAIFLMLIIVMISALGIQYASAAPGTIVNKPVIGQVKIATKSTIALKNVQLIPNGDKQTLAYTIQFMNNESKAINLFDYWTRIKLSNGVTVSPKLTNLNTNKTEIAPKTTAQYTYVATVSRLTNFSDISVQMIKWDFNASNYTRILGTVKIPTGYNSINNESTISLNDTKIGVKINNFRTFQLEDENQIEFDIEYTNLGYRSVTIPQYKYTFITNDKYVYEVNPIKGEDVKIQPKAKAKIQMKMSVPKDMKLKEGNIGIAVNDEQTKVDIPLLTTKVKIIGEVQTETPDRLGTVKSFIYDETKYSVRLDSLQQLPYENENILTATVTVLNATSEVVAIPDLLGTFYLDGVEIIADKVKSTKLSSEVGIPAKGSVQIAFHMKTPYNSNFSTVNLYLYTLVKPSSGETVKEKIANYKESKLNFKPIPNVATGNDVTVTTAGKASNYMIHSVQTYEGGNTIVYNVLLEVQNKESRASLPSNIVAYFKGQNNSYYPLEISEVKDKVNPDGKILMSLVATIPYSANTNGFKLVLGELIDENTYLSAIQFDLNTDDNVSQDNQLNGMTIYPYSLDINTINIGIDRNANVTLYYELEKLSEFDSVPEGHSIIVELVDGKQTYFKELKFETELLLGINHLTVEMPLNIENPNLKIQEVDGFKVNIYDQFKGKKKLLGTRTVYSIFIN